MKNQLVGLLMLVFLASCGTRKMVSTSQTEFVKKDSIVYRETTKIDTIVIPPDTVRVEIPMTALADSLQLELFNLRLRADKKGKANVQLKRVGENIQITATCDSTLIYALSKQVYEKDIQLQSLKQEKEKLIKKTSWITYLPFAGILMFGFLALYLFKR